jgi:hypothetical protein
VGTQTLVVAAMTARAARFSKHAKAMARLYCWPDGRKPGPQMDLNTILRRYYAKVRTALYPAFAPLYAQFQAMQSTRPLRWGGNGATFDVETR